jgi:hypothetical protein
MSDYLSSLAARTIAAPSLTPRVRMRFEPETEEVAPSLEQPATPPHARMTEREETESAPALSERIIEHRTITAKKSGGQAILPVPDVHERDEKQDRRDRLSSTPVVERIAERIEVPRPIVQRETELHERVTERVRTIEQQTAATTHHVTTETREEKQRPHRHDIEPPRVEREQPRAIERVVRQEPRPRERAPIAAPQTSEPTVQISIGRIEVRANAQAAPRASSRARSVMTIDDYVAKQKERR